MNSKIAAIPITPIIAAPRTPPGRQRLSAATAGLNPIENGKAEERRRGDQRRDERRAYHDFHPASPVMTAPGASLTLGIVARSLLVTTDRNNRSSVA
jgi:hypothetical protein